MNIDEIEFNRGAVRPMECLRDGWQLIKENYWLFFGITFVGVLIAGLAPMAILLGPMMCGIYMCLLNQEQGKKVSFETLFQGFNFFVPSLIATLIEVVPIFFLAIVWYVAIMIGTFALLGAGQNRQGPPPGGAVIAFFSIYFGGIFVLITLSLLLKIFFMFTYLLIIEKNLSGWDAVRLSIRAARANFVGLLLLMMLSIMLTMIGLLFCFVGAYFELPLSYAMFTTAYRQIFPYEDPFQQFRDDMRDDEPEDDERPRRLDEPVETSVKVDPAS